METALLYSGTQHSGAGEVQEETMHRFASCVVLSIFLMGASKAAATDGDDKVSPPPKAIDTPAAKPADSEKPTAKASEKDVVQTELHELRNLVEAQSDEIRELRRRLAAVGVTHAPPPYPLPPPPRLPKKAPSTSEPRPRPHSRPVPRLSLPYLKPPHPWLP